MNGSRMGVRIKVRLLQRGVERRPEHKKDHPKRARRIQPQHHPPDDDARGTVRTDGAGENGQRSDGVVHEQRRLAADSSNQGVDAARPQEEVTRDIQERVRDLLPDPVPPAAEANTGSFWYHQVAK